MREWFVGGAVIEGRANDVLLVQNQRKNGSLDWTPPGGVIEVHQNESMIDGLTREVEEETGLVVTGWEGPLYRIVALAPGLGWKMHVEVYRAVKIEGEVRVGEDPDGIVIDAAFVDALTCEVHLADGHPWVREPLLEWLADRWADTRAYHYEVDGDRLGELTVRRV